ncbi:F0F1 ATP synthase subunit B [Blattabacterium cuenoti]|uniref:F0F1 ATP synthase subunit B n=1 Tax=Blattabacterium cuenoti TaxID=1653831 RepID=UPI00163CAD8D|nr:F0F1 ATP synthase subunit B [Blattabacterium cuenoti]
MDLLTPSIGLIVWQTIIFVILMLFLSKYAWTPIIQFIDKREERIRISIEKADQAKKEFKNIEEKKNKILKELRIEKDLILKEAFKIKEDILQNAKKEGFLEKKKMLQEAKSLFQKERKSAIYELKNQIGDISIKIAEKILKEEFDKKELINKQEKFIQELVQNL